MEHLNFLKPIVLSTLLILTSCKGGVIFPLANDIVLDTNDQITSGWSVQSTCVYKSNYTSYGDATSKCPVSIDPSQDPELNIGYWSSCTYPSCEIDYTNSNPSVEDIPTSIKIRSYMHGRDDTKFPPKITISKRVTPNSLKIKVAELVPHDAWYEDSIPFQDLTETSIIYVKLEASYSGANYGVIDKITIISNGIPAPTTTPLPTTEQTSESTATTITETTTLPTSTSDSSSTGSTAFTGTSDFTTDASTSVSTEITTEATTPITSTITTSDPSTSTEFTTVPDPTTTETSESSGSTTTEPEITSTTEFVQTTKTTDTPAPTTSEADTTATTEISVTTSELPSTTTQADTDTTGTTENTETSTLSSSTSDFSSSASSSFWTTEDTDLTTQSPEMGDNETTTSTTLPGYQNGEVGNPMIAIYIFIGPSILLILVLVWSCGLCVRAACRKPPRRREDDIYYYTVSPGKTPAQSMSAWSAEC